MRLGLEKLKLEGHYCLLDEYEALSAQQSLWQSVKQLWYSQCVLCDTHKEAMFYFRSSAARYAEKERHHLSRDANVIHPFSRIRLLWQTVMIGTYGAAFGLIPYTYGMFIKGNRYSDEPRTKDTVYCDFVRVLAVINVVCWADVVMNFRTGYRVKTTKAIVLNRRRIACRYITGYFLIDVISSFPLEMLLWNLIEPHSPTFSFFSLSYVIVGTMATVKFLRVGTFLTYIHQVARGFGAHVFVYRSLHMAVVFGLLLHWSACMQYVLPHLIYQEDLMVMNSTDFDRSWLHAYRMHNQTVANRVMRCSIRIMMQINTVGICAPSEKLLLLEAYVDRVVLVILGRVFCAYVLANILLMSVSYFHSEYQYCDMMDQLRQFMYHKQMPSRMQARLRCFYEYRYQGRFHRPHAILAAIPEVLVREMRMMSCRHLVESVGIFRDLPRDVVQAVVYCLHQEIFLKGDVIIRCDTVGSCMYFLTSGTVSVRMPETREDHCYYKEVARLVDGAHFGEVCMLDSRARRNASVVAVETCECSRLERDDFARCIAGNQELLAKLSDVSDRRRSTLFSVDNALL